LTGLVRGTYTVTVTDAKGCTDVLSITLTAPPAIKIDTANVLNPTCTYRTDGSASVIVSGGVGSYTYVWNPNPDTDSIADNIGQGNYSVTVTDGNGCPKSTSFVIQLTDTFAINLTFKNVSCKDASDGKIFLNATGGKPAYSYTWSPSVSTVDSAVGLSPNTYQVTVYDANQCSITTSQAITEPTLLTADTSNVIKNNCFGIADGAATVTPLGGTPGYVLSASDGTNNYTATNNNFSNLPAGSYSYVVTDTNGCSVQGNFDIARAIPDVVALTTDSATCFQSTDGAIHVKASGNVPYTFSTDSISFVNGATPDENTFAGLGKGTYSIFVKNPNGCIVKGIDSIGEPEDITATAVPDSVYIELGDSAVLQVNITGVTNPVITWSPAEGLSCTSCANPIARPTKDTEYTVKVSRSNNKDCYKDATAKVKVSVEIAIPNAFTPNVDGKNEKFFPISNSTNFTVNAFKIYNRWGELVHGENTPWDGSYKGTPQPAEVYVYHVEITKPDTNNPNVTKTIIKEGSFTLLR
jgi:gliding motility-associated-like protein